MTVFFDLDRTLMDFESAENSGIFGIYDSYKNEIKMKKEEFVFEWKKWAQIIFDEYSKGLYSFDEQRHLRIKKIFELNGKNLTQDEVNFRFERYWSIYESSYELFPDALPFLKNLKNHSVKIGLITNGDSQNQRKKLQKSKITDFFDFIIISSEIGISKPDLKVFEKAKKMCGEKTEKIFYIGDSYEHDIEPSLKSGFNTIWFRISMNEKFLINQKNPLFAEVCNLYEAEKILQKYL